MHPESASEKGLFAGVKALTRGTGFRFATYLETAEALSGNVDREVPSCALLGLATACWYLPEKGLSSYLKP